MQHFLITLKQNKEGQESVFSSYYADAKGFTPEELWKMPESILTKIASLIITEGYEVGVKEVLEPVYKSSSIMVVAACILAIVKADLRRPNSRFRKPGSRYSIYVSSCCAPATDTLRDLRLAQGGIEIRSFKTPSEAEKCHVTVETEAFDLDCIG